MVQRESLPLLLDNLSRENRSFRSPGVRALLGEGRDAGHRDPLEIRSGGLQANRRLQVKPFGRPAGTPTVSLEAQTEKSRSQVKERNQQRVAPR